MTSKQRIAAAMKCEPADRLPFWPKLDIAYEIYNGGKSSDYHEYIGSDPIIGIGNPFREVRRETELKIINDGRDQIIKYVTPYGELTQVNRFDAGSQSHHPIEFPVKTRAHIEMMKYWYEDAEIIFDADLCENANRRYKEAGDAAYIIETLGISPLMTFIEWLAGIENGHYFLADHPDEVNELFSAMHKNMLKGVEISAEKSAADALNLNENTSTTLISPEQYKKYCLPLICEYGKITDASNRPLMLHMCGHLKALLPMLNETPAAAFEAFTSPAVGNTTLADGRKICPEKCLIGGTNAAVWLQSPEEIFFCIEESLNELPHHRGICVTSAGVMPPACGVETIKKVKDRLDGYRVRM